MEPRLKSSKKWTNIPAEMLTQICEVFTENFMAAAQRGQFFAEGRIYPEELLLSVGYLEKGRLARANFEVSIEFNAKKENALKLIHAAVDCAASMMEQYDQREDDEDVELPRQWTEYELEGKKVYLQYTTNNPELEAQADRLLGLSDNDDLVKGEVDEEELKARITMLGLDEDEDDEGKRH